MHTAHMVSAVTDVISAIVAIALTTDDDSILRSADVEKVRECEALIGGLMEVLCDTPDAT